MDFYFIPNIGTNVIRFGMTAMEIFEALSVISHTSRQDNFYSNLSACNQWYNYDFCQVRFDQEGKCDKISFSSPAQLYCDQKPVLQQPIGDVQSTLLQLDADLHINDMESGFFISYDYGISTTGDGHVITSVDIEKKKNLDFTLIPHIGTDIIQFGMTSEQISQAFGVSPESICQDNTQTDYYEFCQVFFDEKKTCNEIQFCRPAQVYWNGNPLLGKPGAWVTNLFLSEEPDLQIRDKEDGDFVSHKYDIGVSGSEGRVETVAWTRKGNYANI